jgi:hypothetical protein
MNLEAGNQDCFIQKSGMKAASDSVRGCCWLLIADH